MGFVLFGMRNVDTNSFVLAICCWANINGAISGNALTQLCVGKECPGNDMQCGYEGFLHAVKKKSATQISWRVIRLSDCPVPNCRG